MKNLSIRAKMIILFSVINVMIFAIGLFGCLGLKDVANTLNDFYDCPFTNLQHFDSLGENLNQAAKNYLHAILDPTEEITNTRFTAAVEAARAGAAGKGFAVVADEVRNLAAKSAEAAANTNTLIENTIASVDKGNRLCREVAEMMTGVTEAAGKVAEFNTGIFNSSAKLAGSVEQVNMGMGQISGVVQNNSATAEESAAASEELSGQATMLEQLVGEFVLE